MYRTGVPRTKPGRIAHGPPSHSLHRREAVHNQVFREGGKEKGKERKFDLGNEREREKKKKKIPK
jgi:hypothetical protein